MHDEASSITDSTVDRKALEWHGSSNMRLSISRVERHSPRSATPTLRRAFSSRPPKPNAYVKIPEASEMLIVSEARISSVDPFKMHPPTGLAGPDSLPVPGLEVQDLQNKTSDGVGGNDKQADVAGADKVNAKVSAMLAATEALKPVPSLAADMAGSKFTRLVTKVSDAFDKVHTRPRSTADHIDVINHRLSVSSSTNPPVETIHIRLNESDNLNRKKVQKMFGSQIARKPVMDDGKSLRSKKSGDNPRTETVALPALSTIDNCASCDADDVIRLRLDAFEGEEDFDSDLEFRILSMTPEGSSTPRVVSPLASSMSCSPRRKPVSTPKKKSFEDTSLQEVDMFLSTESPERLGRKRLAAPESFEHHAAQESPDDCKRVKKHPSPDKQYLESLEEALQKYNTLKMSGADDDELDELAGNFTRSPLRSLAPRDSNRLMRGSMTLRSSDSPDPAQECRSQMTLFPRRNSCNPKSVESHPKLSTEIRLVSRLRPRDAGADDSDELL